MSLLAIGFRPAHQPSGKDDHASTGWTHGTNQRTRVFGYPARCHGQENCMLLERRVRRSFRVALGRRLPPRLVSVVLVIEIDLQRTDIFGDVPAAASADVASVSSKRARTGLASRRVDKGCHHSPAFRLVQGRSGHSQAASPCQLRAPRVSSRYQTAPMSSEPTLPTTFASLPCSRSSAAMHDVNYIPNTAAAVSFFDTFSAVGVSTASSSDLRATQLLGAFGTAHRSRDRCPRCPLPAHIAIPRVACRPQTISSTIVSADNGSLKLTTCSASPGYAVSPVNSSSSFQTLFVSCLSQASTSQLSPSTGLVWPGGDQPRRGQIDRRGPATSTRVCWTHSPVFLRRLGFVPSLRSWLFQGGLWNRSRFPSDPCTLPVQTRIWTRIR